MKKFLTFFAALLFAGSMAYADCYVAGTMTGWNPSSNDYKMNLVGPDVYALSLTGLSSEEFKVVYNDVWYGISQADMTLSDVTLTGGDNVAFTASDVTIYFNSTTQKIIVREGGLASFSFPANTTIYYDFKTYNNGVNIYNSVWNNEWKSDVSSIISVELTSAWTITYGSSLFKSAASNNWQIVMCSSLPAEGQNMLVSTDGSTYHWDTYVPSGDDTDPEQEPEQESATYTVAGSSTAFGSDWTPSDANNDMALVGELYTLVKENLTLYDDIQFKVCKDHGWAQAWPTDNYVLAITEGGVYTITITFNEDSKMINASAEKTGEAAPESVTYTVAGSSTDAFGTSWNAADENNDMALVEELYTWSKADLTFAGGSNIEFKVCKNHSFDPSWPSENYVLNIPEDGIYTITITFNEDSKDIIASANKTGEAEIEPTAVVKGSWDNWDADVALVNAGDGLSASGTLSLGVASYKFKMIINGEWRSNGYEYHRSYTGAEGIEGNTQAEMTLTTDVAGDYIITWTYASNAISIEFPAEPEPTYTVAGSSEAIFGTTWDANIAANDMVLDEGIYKFEKENVILAAGNVTLKVLKNHDWDQAWPNDNYELAIPESGEYTISITFDPSNNGVSASATKTGDAVVEQTVEMKGSWDEWVSPVSFTLAQDGNSASVTKALSAGSYEFKLLLNSNDWRGNGYTYHREYTGTDGITSDGANMILTADIAGDYTFTWTFADNAISIEFPELTWTVVRSGLEVDRHYTVCLVRKMVYAKGATFWSLANKNNENTMVYLEEANAPFEAGKPYIFQATADKLEVVYDGDAVDGPVENGALRGTFDYMDAAALEAVEGTVYMLFNNELRPLGTNNHLDAYRAYVLYNELTVGTPQEAPGRRVKAMPMQGQVATDIDALNASEAPVKMLIDGKMYILRGEKLYDATGRIVK